MQKQAPSLGRILTMVLFALSCFGLLLFLWLAFGGAIPLKPSGYRFRVAFPEATQLGLESDVRVAGVSVGKVRAKELDPNGGRRTIATIELDRRFAPVRTTARAILRQKTLLGETYVELTRGTQGSPTVKENGFLSNSNVEPTVELDEILQALDPTTREAFHSWQQSLAQTVNNRGQDFSDVLGNLPQFSTNGADLLQVLDEQSTDVRNLIRNTGNVFAALSANEGQLRTLITSGEDTFGAIASQNEALAETIRIFPVFLDESRLTFAKLKTFSLNTDPLIKDLKPVARDLGPTLHSVRLLAPDLKRLFQNLGPLIEVSKKGLPALRDTLVGARPLLDHTGPFLAQLNPILEFLELYQHQVRDFISNGPYALANTAAGSFSGGLGHYLRQLGPLGLETAAIYTQRPAVDRGNTYPRPIFLAGNDVGQHLIFPNWDCVPSGGPVENSPNGPPLGNGTPACFVQGPVPSDTNLAAHFPNIQRLYFPHVNKAHY
ncbi:MAG: phospholipid/cholesterol/gamma-HCH transport system substrate-binding protein [Solirubrobacteraceae bacterium]|jgi:virulence factor Mce-like protein|nr:phospholipid/cholesterol/gamma-HCH transport system substrate-binding protein [Solirubrobacteraceae bacterium]